MPLFQLKRPFYDDNGAYHEPGTKLHLSEDDAPKSAINLDEDPDAMIDDDELPDPAEAVSVKPKKTVKKA